MLSAADLSGRARGSQGAVELIDHLRGWTAFAGPPPLGLARCGADRAGGQACPLAGLREGRKRLARIGLARKGGAASGLNGVDRLVRQRVELLVGGALRLRLAGLGGDADPAWLDSTVGRRPLVSALARWEWGHGRRIGLGQGAVCVAHGRGPPRAPRERRRGALSPGLLAIAGARGAHGGGAIRGWSRMAVGLDHPATRLWITAIAAERLHQCGQARLVLDDPRPQDLVEGRAMSATIARGDGPDLCGGGRRCESAPRHDSSSCQGAYRWGAGPDA